MGQNLSSSSRKACVAETVSTSFPQANTLMKSGSDDEAGDGIEELSLIDKYGKLFSELENGTEGEQKLKIFEMNGLMSEMAYSDVYSIFTKELFDRMDKMVERKRLSIENACLLVQRVGYWKMLKNPLFNEFKNSFLNRRFEKMIVKEEKKRKRRNENLLVGLCECYLSLNSRFSSELLSICVPCLLKVALNKEECKEAQKEVEMALLSLSKIVGRERVLEKLYLNEIKEIIKYHQDHQNLTRLAYHSAWEFLIARLGSNRSLADVITNELHFVAEATRELEELSSCADLKTKEVAKRKKEVKEIVGKWIKTAEELFLCITSWKEEYAELISFVAKLYRASREKEQMLCERCFSFFNEIANNATESVGYFLKEGVFDIFCEDLQQSTLEDVKLWRSFGFLSDILKRLNEKKDNDVDEVKRKATKKEMFERMEEEGYEDCITSFFERFNFLNKRYSCDALSLNVSDYHVNV
ncbi:uncharacterized protein MONOS_18647 [Monocercomonoides exilis]|uniref:uncharacterized protein n=1 Tax=Monocercomonoides exilis TaxID=2049356 RepID=UPI0035598194|nr:hypothetical protein MONOS_18647 [Monocercomonoides exilis]